MGMFAGLLLGVALTAGVSMVRGQTTDGSTAWVPDMEQIYLTALGNAFDGAGEKFTDPELKAFYDRLTSDITGSLATPVAFDPGIVVPTMTPTPIPTVVPTPVPTLAAAVLVTPPPFAVPAPTATTSMRPERTK